MKKIKMSLIALFVCALGYVSYSAYEYMTMTDAERFLLQNIEALTTEEPGGGYNDNCTIDVRYRARAYTTVCNLDAEETCSDVQDKEPLGNAKYRSCVNKY